MHLPCELDFFFGGAVKDSRVWVGPTGRWVQ